MTTQKFIDECKNMAYKNRLGKFIVGDNEKVISYNDDLVDMTIDESCYNNGTIIGTVYTKKAEFNLFDNGNDYSLIDKIVYPKIGVKYDDSSEEYIDMGKYTVQRPTNEQTANFTNFKAYDDFINLDEEYVCGITDWTNATVRDFYIDLCKQVSLIPKKLDFINNDIPVTGNPFQNGEKRRDVLSDIAEVACSFPKIYRDTNEIDLCWLDYGQIVSATGTSNIELNDCVNAPIEFLKVDGKSYQQVTTEYNLIKKDGLSTVKTDTNFWNNVSSGFTPLNDGWGHYEFDNTLNSQIAYINSFINQNGVSLSPNTQYTVLLEIRNADGIGGLNVSTGTNTKNPFIETYSLEWTDEKTDWSTSTTFLLTTKEDLTNMLGFRIFGLVRANKKVSFDARIMLIESNHINDDLIYSAYTPNSPSPNYLSKVESVGQIKNIFNGQLEIGNLGSAGENTQVSYRLRSKDYIAIEPNTKYTISNDIFGGAIVVCYYNSNKTFVKRKVYTLEEKKYTLTTPFETSFLRFCNDGTLANPKTNMDVKYQIEKGTIATDYIAHRNYLEILVGNGNLFNKSDIKNGYYLNQNGIEMTDSSWCLSDYIKIFDSLYYNGLTTVGNAPRSCFYDKDKKFISSFKQVVGKEKVQVPDRAEYVRFSIMNKASENIYDKNTFIVSNCDINSYINHEEQNVVIDLKNNEICSLQNGTKDIFYIQNGHAYLEKRVGKFVFDNTDKYSILKGESSVPNYDCFTIKINDVNKNIKKGNVIAPYTNFAKGKADYSYTKFKNEITQWSDVSTDFCMNLSGVPSEPADFKEYLQSENDTGIPFYILYEMQDSVIIDLGEVDDIFTYENNTMITLESAITTTMECGYYTARNLTYDQYSTLDGGQIVYGPVNSLVIKESQIEGENVTVEDNDSISEFGETQIAIIDNYFLNTENLRKMAIGSIWKRIRGLKYVDYKITSYTGKPYYEVGNKIRVHINDGRSFDSYILINKNKYDGTFYTEISGPALTKQETKLKNTPDLKKRLQQVEFISNKVDGELVGVVKQVDTNTTITNEMKITLDSMSQKYEKIGGRNLIHNSVGLLTNNLFWINSEIGNFTQGYRQSLVGRTESASEIAIQNGRKTTTSDNIINVVVNKEITLSFKLTNEENTTTTVKLIGNGTIYEYTTSEVVELEKYEFTFLPNTTNLVLEITSTTTQQGWTRISDLMLSESKIWEMASDEIWSRVIETTPYGQLTKAENVNTGLFLGLDGLGIYDLQNGSLGEQCGYLNKDGLLTNKVECLEINQNNLINTNININGNETYIRYIRGSQ